MKLWVSMNGHLLISNALTKENNLERMAGYMLNVAEIFGENVFNDSVMQERLPRKTYQELKKQH